LDYLFNNGFKAVAETFQKDANLPAPDTKSKGMLEKKWSSIARMQRKVCFYNILSPQTGSDPPPLLCINLDYRLGEQSQGPRIRTINARTS